MNRLRGFIIGCAAGVLLYAAGPAAALTERPLASPPTGPGAAIPTEDAPITAAPEAPAAAEAQAVTPTAEEEAAYVDNNPFEDFQVHFFVSLPFTGLYSYVAVSSLDALVQGTFPTELRQSDIWVIIGLAVGTSLAVALGSAGRVPDQSRPRLETPPDRDHERQSRAPAAKLPLVRMSF